MIEFERAEMKYGEALRPDQEWVLAGAVQGAAVLDHPQAADRRLILNAVIEEDHAVGDVLVNAVAGQRPLSRFDGDYGGDALVLQPPEQPAQLRAQDVVVAETGEQRFERVTDDPLGADGLNRALQADKQPFEMILAGLFDLTPFHANIIHRQLLARAESRQIKTHRRNVGDQLLVRRLEGHEDAGLIEFGCPTYEDLHRQHGLAAPAEPQTSIGRP